MAKNWIAKATKNKGAYRKATGTKGNSKISKSRMAADAKKPGRIGKQARLAQTLAKLRKKKK